MDACELIGTTGCAAFSTDENGQITAWNAAARELLGHSSEDMIGRACSEILCGADMFGNRFCDEDCAVLKMARKGEAVRNFQIDISGKNGQALRAGICTMVVNLDPVSTDGASARFQLIHLIQPVEGPTINLEHLRESRNGKPVRSGHATGIPLTGRETEVLILLEEGISTQTMADSLGISVTTVRNHIQGILRKLGAHSRLEAVSSARRLGMI
jgi:DNA-binding CsgD family transcriptional regulator